jgi:hypothetical protein
MGTQHFVVVYDDHYGNWQNGSEHHFDHHVKIEFHYTQGVGKKEITHQDRKQNPKVPAYFLLNGPYGRRELLRKEARNKKQVNTECKKGYDGKTDDKIIFLFCIERIDIEWLK